MKQVSISLKSIQVSMRTGPDVCDITLIIRELIKASQIGDGSLHATVIGSTASITTIEFEPGAIEDLKKAVNRLALPGLEYEHEKAWHDGNGHSHVQAALIGPSVVLPVRGSQLKLGTWQQVVVINHDNRPRTRAIEVTIIGTSE